MGIEKNLVYTYLEQVDANVALANRSAFITVEDQSQSEGYKSLAESDREYQNPFRTCRQLEEGRGVLSQREGPQTFQSPLLDSLERNELFRSTGGPQTMRPLTIPQGQINYGGAEAMTIEGHSLNSSPTPPQSQNNWGARLQPAIPSDLGVSEKVFSAEQRGFTQILPYQHQLQHPSHNSIEQQRFTL